MSVVALGDCGGGVGGAGVADGDGVDEVADGVEAAGEGGGGVFCDHGEFEGGHGGQRHLSETYKAFLTRLTPLGCAEAHPYNCWVLLSAVAQLDAAFSWAWLLASWERWARSIWRRRSRVGCRLRRCVL